nr:MAG TPA: Helix-turn-helix XRE-family like protein [Caudoviricetes sp.]
MTNINNTLTISLKSARVNANLTLVEASKRLGVSKSTLIKWEREPWLVNSMVQDKISEVYCIPIDNIMFKNFES